MPGSSTPSCSAPGCRRTWFPGGACWADPSQGSPDRFILALDDYHHITEPAIAEPVVGLIEHLPQGMRLALATGLAPAPTQGPIREQANQVPGTCSLLNLAGWGSSRFPSTRVYGTSAGHLVELPSWRIRGTIGSDRFCGGPVH
jgi:hypothetical protein